MKTVAITNTFNDNVTILPVTGSIDSIGDVMFHNNPCIEFDGHALKKNFDYHIDFNLSTNKLHSELLPDEYISYPRLRRQTQYIKISRYNNNRPENAVPLHIPKFYISTNRSGEHLAIANYGLPTTDKVVIKDSMGARGSNQIVVPTNMLTTLLKHSKGLTFGEIKIKFPDLIYSDNSNWDKVLFNTPADIFISDLIPSVAKEWRLLVGGNNIYGREREIKPGPYRQANLNLDIIQTVPDVKYTHIEEMFDNELVISLYGLINSIDLPIGSLDLYITEDGQYGLFEYSSQYAFHAADPHFIRKLHLDGIDKIINKLNSNKK